MYIPKNQALQQLGSCWISNYGNSPKRFTNSPVMLPHSPYIPIPAPEYFPNIAQILPASAKLGNKFEEFGDRG